MKTKLLALGVILSLAVGCQAAPPFIAPHPVALSWTINDTNATATNIKAYDGTNWNTVASVGAPTNTIPLAGLPLAVLCATSVEGTNESDGSNQITNAPAAVAPAGLVKK